MALGAVGVIISQPMLSGARLKIMRTYGILAALFLAGCASSLSSYQREQLYEKLSDEARAFNESYAQDQRAIEKTFEPRVSAIAAEHVDLLIQDLKAGDVKSRLLAAFALGFLRQGKVVPELLAATGDPHRGVRVNALQSLGVLGVLKVVDVKVAPILLERLKPMMHDRDVEIAASAMFALQNLIAEGEDPGLSEDVHALLGHPHPKIRNEAVILAGRLKKKEFASKLIDRTSDGDEADLVVRNATTALTAILGEDAVPILIELMNHPSTHVVKKAGDNLRFLTKEEYGDAYGIWKNWYEQKQREKSEKARYEYYCPTCGFVQSDPGMCSKCNVTLRERLKARKDDYEYYCPDHGNPQPKAGKCTTCQRDLVPRPKRKFACPDGHVHSDKPGKCEQCQKDLIEKK